MKVKIIGYQSQDYKLDNGFQFQGFKVHAEDLDSAPAGLTGHLTTTFRISSDSELAKVPLLVGEEYHIYFTQKGAVDFLKHV